MDFVTNMKTSVTEAVYNKGKKIYEISENIVSDLGAGDASALTETILRSAFDFLYAEVYSDEELD